MLLFGKKINNNNDSSVLGSVFVRRSDLTTMKRKCQILFVLYLDRSAPIESLSHVQKQTSSWLFVPVDFAMY